MGTIIKPISIRYNECIEKLCAVINESQLPAFATVNILEKITAEARKLADDEYKRDVEAYNKQLSEQTEATDN